MVRVIILAAGQSSRFWPLASEYHKSFYFLGTGKRIVEYTVFNLLNNIKNIFRIDLVVSPRDEKLAKRIFAKTRKVSICVQESPEGEGAAILQVHKSSKIKSKFFVTSGDKVNAYAILKKIINKSQSIALRETDTPHLYGIATLKNEKITHIKEKPRSGKYRITSAYLLNKKFLDFLSTEGKDHYSFESALNKYVKRFEVYGVLINKIPDITLKYPWHLLQLNQTLQNKIKSKISKSAEVAKTAIIRGKVVIEKNARILDFATIIGPAFINEGSVVGSYSLLRDNVYLGKNVIVGANSEVKNSMLFDDVHLHRNFIGDSVIDENTKIGAGVITANKRIDRKNVQSVVKGEKVDSGFNSFGAIIGKDVTIGINCSIMPGVKIEKGSTVLPHLLIKKDI